MNRRFARFVLLACCLLPLAGCWDRTEINDVAFVVSSGVDLEKDGRIRITVMVPLPGQMGGATGGGGGTSGSGKSYYLDSEVGKTFREAQARLQERMSRRMFFGHRRTMVIGEDVAKAGISDLFDSSPRNSENRMSSYIIATTGKAYELLQATPKFERFPSEVIRELAKAHYVIDMNMKDIGVALNAPGSDPVMVYMDPVDSQKSENKSKEITVKGYMQFKGDKLVDKLENEQAQGYAWLRNESIKTTVTLDDLSGKPTGIGLRVRRIKTSIKPELLDQRLKFRISVQAKAVLLEDDRNMDLSQPKNVEKIERMLNEYIKKAIIEVIEKCKKNNADSVQFGTFVWRSYPDEWKKKFAASWPEGLKEAEYDVDVSSMLIETGLIYENVTKGHRLK
ncbi:Ger(x)C family spore germination protein [Paenibacillus doosanensis]|uniref:Ger(x)C family spore germination protein n=1 Tax=Paenibacillus doosanensis TaxID=1229154 RepID=UPI00217FDB29|nr:Ger(x)C family spore germination protein [Paenibacillus doosanensis]MCS7463252.1 Ger(x)C family spore germination protein [Paenibacillus doosanensis]